MRLIVLFALVVSACTPGARTEVATTLALAPVVRLVPEPADSANSSNPTSPRPAVTTTSSSSTEAPAPSVCEAFGEPVALGTITDPALVEISGMAVGRDGVIWVHNDSGTAPRLWALDGSGVVLGSVAVPAANTDWEDMSVGPGPGGEPYFYLADIGDNLERRTSVTIYRFEEPLSPDAGIDVVESLEVRYPAGPVDAEAFLVDPVTGDSFIVTKTLTGRSSVFRIPAGAWDDGSFEAQDVATIDLGGLSLVTAGAITSDGSLVALRTYLDVWLWPRLDGETVSEALVRAPCRAPSARERQGESLGFDSSGYLTVSEGVESVIYRIGRATPAAASTSESG